VLHVLEAVHHEGDTEARPEPGEAEGGAEEPGHEAWLAGGRGRDSELTVRTLDGGRVRTKLGNWNLEVKTLTLISYPQNGSKISVSQNA